MKRKEISYDSGIVETVFVSGIVAFVFVFVSGVVAFVFVSVFVFVFVSGIVLADIEA